MKRGGYLKRTSKPLKRGWLKRDPFGLKKRSKKSNRVSYKEEQWKKAVRERDDFTCRFPGCSFRSKSIDAHHIAMRSRRPDLKFVVENGIALCRSHHAEVHAHPIESVAMGLLSDETYEKAKNSLAA